MNFVAFPSRRVFKSQEDAIEYVIKDILDGWAWWDWDGYLFEWCVKELIEGIHIEDSTEVVTESEIFTLMEDTGRLKKCLKCYQYISLPHHKGGCGCNTEKI